MSILSSNNTDLRSVKIQLKDFERLGWKLSKDEYMLAAPGCPFEKWAFHEELQTQIRIVYDHAEYVEYVSVRESKYISTGGLLRWGFGKIYNMYDLHKFMKWVNFIKENYYTFS